VYVIAILNLLCKYFNRVGKEIGRFWPKAEVQKHRILPI